MLNYILLACIARLLIRLSTRIYEILKTYNEFSSLINLASNEDSCVRREAIEKLCELTSDKNPPSAKVHEILEVFTAAANDVHVNTKQNALRGIITLIEKDKLLEDKIEDVFKLFVAESSNTSDNVKAHALSGINKLVEKDKLPIAKTEEVLDLFIIGVGVTLTNS